MTLQDELAALLAEPAESITVDFQEHVGWDTPRGKLALTRAIVCLSNRLGGLLIIGVKDRGSSRFEPVGLDEREELPDPTDLAKLIRRYFEPVPEFTVHEVIIDERRFGVVKVVEFRQFPSICTAIGNVPDGDPVVRPGYLYRRSDQMDCAPAQSYDAVAGMIHSAVAKTGAATARMLAPSPASEPEDVPARAGGDGTPVRYCDLTPTPVPPRQGSMSIQDRIARAAVRSYGGMMLPRGFHVEHLEPSAVIRETERVVIDRSPEESYSRVQSFIEVSRNLRVRIREGLWEADGTVDYTALFSFVFACLEFAHRFYGDPELRVASVKVTTGLSKVLGRRLVDDPARFWPFLQSYVATSPGDLAVARDIPLGDLADPENCFAVGRAMIEELGEYFGFRVADDAFDAHVRYVRQSVDVGRILPEPAAGEEGATR